MSLVIFNMNILLFYNLLIYLIIRSLGLGISIDFYFNRKETRFQLAILGWGSWVIASVSSILAVFTDIDFIIELLLFLNSLFVSLGTILYIWTIFSYFLEVPKRIFISLLIILIIFLPIIFILVNYKLAINLTVIITTILLFSVYIVPIWKWKGFKETMGLALKWYYIFLVSLAIYIVVSLYISTQDLEYYGIYSTIDTFLIILNYIPSIIFTMVLIILLIHVEYNFSITERSELKDKYSHDLGNILQYLRGYIDLFSQKKDIKEEDSNEFREKYQEKCQEAADLLKEIRQL